MNNSSNEHRGIPLNALSGEQRAGTTALAELWDTYQKQVLPADAGELQLRECRRAFYTGAMGLLEHIQHIPEGREVEFTEDLQAEFAAFTQQVSAGWA